MADWTVLGAAALTAIAAIGSSAFTGFGNVDAALPKRQDPPREA
jgi:hypothetical protein